MSKTTWIALGAAFAAVVAANTIEIEGTIEGKVAFTSDQFTRKDAGCPKNCYVPEMKHQIIPDVIGTHAHSDKNNGKWETDHSKEEWWRIVPVDTGKEFYRVSLTTPKDKNPVELKAGDKVKITYKDTAWGHLENYFASRKDHPYATPIVHGATLEIIPK